MSNQTKMFHCPTTGESKEFIADSYQNDTTTMRSTRRESVEIHFFRAADGERIDRQTDGSYKTKWGVVWVPA